jgi:hypothetical protein
MRETLRSKRILFGNRSYIYIHKQHEEVYSVSVKFHARLTTNIRLFLFYLLCKMLQFCKFSNLTHKSLSPRF